MLRHTILAIAPLLLAGCVAFSPSVPEGYTGPQARLEDSAKVYSGSKADFFVLSEIDGKSVRNSLHETVRRNHGRGFVMTPYFITHDVVAGQPLKVTVMGRTVYAAPILALTNDVYEIKGVVEFIPQDDGRYLVRGELSPNYSAVWIEDRATNAVVGTKVEIQGSAKVGFWEK
jgi:hypothetical protein